MPKKGYERKERWKMALSKAQVREILSAAGVDSEHMSEAVSKIIDGHTASIEALREKVATLEKEAGENAAVAEKLEATEKELAGLKERVAAEAKEREGKDYDKLKEEFDSYKAEQETKAARAAKESAFRELLKDAEIDSKYHDKIVKYSKLDDIEFTKDGKIKDAKDRIKAVEEEWPEYKVTFGQKGADTVTPPTNNGGSGMTKEQIEAIEDTTERQKAMAENHELFGF